MGMPYKYLVVIFINCVTELGNTFFFVLSSTKKIYDLHSSRSSTDSLDHITQNQPGSSLVLADCVRFCPNGSGLEESQCARIIAIGPASTVLVNASKPTWVRYEWDLARLLGSVA